MNAYFSINNLTIEQYLPMRAIDEIAKFQDYVIFKQLMLSVIMQFRDYDYKKFIRDMVWIVFLKKFVSVIKYFPLLFQLKIRPIFIF
jgi:hypothetical protein